MKTASLWNHATNYGNQQLFTQLFVFNDGNHNHFWALEVVKIKRLFQMVMSKQGCSSHSRDALRKAHFTKIWTEPPWKNSQEYPDLWGILSDRNIWIELWPFCYESTELLRLCLLYVFEKYKLIKEWKDKLTEVDITGYKLPSWIFYEKL